MQATSFARPVRARLLMVLAAAAATLVPSVNAWGLINVNFTPVDLYNRSTAVVTLELAAPDAEGNLALRSVAALKGQAPEGLRIHLDPAQARLVEEIRGAMGTEAAARGLILWGDFSGAAMGDRTAEAPAAMLHVGTTWVALYRQADGRYEIQADAQGLTDPLDLKTVWAGSTVMLEECLRYIERDARAEVPVLSDSVWEEIEIVDDLPGAATQMLLVDLAREGVNGVLIASPAGDRYYRPRNGSLVDATDSIGLSSASDLLTTGDFNGSGRIDLASWNAEEGKLTVLVQQADGTFTPLPSVAIDGPVLSLSPAYGGANRRQTAIVAGRPGVPLRVRLTDEGLNVQPISLNVEPISSAPIEATGVGPCVVADFDGDALADVFQPRSMGGLLYRGRADGSYEPPQLVVRGEWSGVHATLAGDFDANGRLDIVLAGRQGVSFLTNEGGTFRERLGETGELAYISRPGITSAVLCDVNNDGRQELSLLYPNARPHVYFNRGFRCFGYALDLEESLDEVDFEALDALEVGQTAGVFADFTGNGATDFAVSTPDGKLLLLRRGGSASALGLTVSLPASANGPVTVRAIDGRRDLGARLVLPGQPVVFGKTGRGPLDLFWTWPGQARQAHREVVIRPVRLELPAHPPRMEPPARP